VDALSHDADHRLRRAPRVRRWGTVTAQTACDRAGATGQAAPRDMPDSGGGAESPVRSRSEMSYEEAPAINQTNSNQISAMKRTSPPGTKMSWGSLRPADPGSHASIRDA
jgi:hypothetical protein